MAGYTRQDSSNDIANGKTVKAATFDAEYDQIEVAFNSTTGHTHDGSTDEGAPIEVTGPAQDYLSTAAGFTPKTNDAYDLGSASLQWKDLYVDGVAYLDSVDIDAGSIDGTPIGANSASTGVFTTVTASGGLVGNSDTATALETARDITLDGDVSGSTSFDGTSNVTITVSYGPIDDVVIGGNTPAAATFTTITCGGLGTFEGDVSIESTTPGCSFTDTDASFTRFKISNAGGNARFETDRDSVGGPNSYLFEVAGTEQFRIKTGAIKIPTGTSAQRPSSPVNGDFRKNTTTGFVEIYNGSAWESFNVVPVGGIILWSGSVATIPSGWAICDGSNGTPDLTGRFVVHADADSGGTYDVDDSGGSADAIVVEHTHGAGTLATETAGAHTHSYEQSSVTGVTTGASSLLAGNLVQDLTASNGDHTHTITGSTASTGSSGTNANLPPYYALAYIMRTA